MLCRVYRKPQSFKWRKYSESFRQTLQECKKHHVFYLKWAGGTSQGGKYPVHSNSVAKWLQTDWVPACAVKKASMVNSVASCVVWLLTSAVALKYLEQALTVTISHLDQSEGTFFVVVAGVVSTTASFSAVLLVKADVNSSCVWVVTSRLLLSSLWDCDVNSNSVFLVVSVFSTVGKTLVSSADVLAKLVSEVVSFGDSVAGACTGGLKHGGCLG